MTNFEQMKVNTTIFNMSMAAGNEFRRVQQVPRVPYVDKNSETVTTANDTSENFIRSSVSEHL